MLSEIIQQEKETALMIEELKQNLVQEIRQSKAPGRRVGPNMCVVWLSELQNNILSAEYYIPDSQANHVEQALSGVTTASDFAAKLESMVTEREVRINKNRYPLNPTTIAVLQKCLQC